jgi:hypothetical protein
MGGRIGIVRLRWRDQELQRLSIQMERFGGLWGGLAAVPFAPASHRKSGTGVFSSQFRGRSRLRPIHGRGRNETSRRLRR